LLKPSDCLLYLVNDAGDGLTFYPCNRRKTPRNPAIGEGIAGWVIQNGKEVLAPDGPAHNRYSKKTDLIARRAARVILCVPIISGKDVQGAIEVLGKKFTRKSAQVLHTIADFAAIAIENSRYVAEIEELTITDDLTGLFNARYLTRVIDMEIRRAERYGEEFSVVFIDLDRFKGVNDTFGHLVGSRILKETGQLIADALRRDIDSAFRYGGDEFVLVLPKTGSDGAIVVAKRIQQMVRNNTFQSDDGDNFHLTASIGIAMFPKDALSREDIVRMADEAMYEVKRKGRDGIFFHRR
jgi:diguanylate cyclase (GGDEF)-like protein